MNDDYNKNLDKIIMYAQNIEKLDKHKHYYITMDYACTWETEDDRIRRKYKDGEITQEEAFLGLL